MRHILLIGALTLGLIASTPACDEPTGDEVSLDVSPLIDGQPEAVGVLRFLNDASTTFSRLDQEVRLDRRAAENLIAWRDGPDGVFGTSDDRPFTRIDEVLAVRWVGPAALDRILTFARDGGWIPEGDALLGVYKGVSFSVIAAEATVAFVNTASQAVLRGDVGLQARTANQIVMARPLLSVEALSNVLYVGTVSLERLRDHALSIDPPIPCLDDGACADGARCHHADPASGLEGVCRQDSELAGVIDGVSFTFGEEHATLRLSNLASAGLLRGDVGLTARAVENLIDARPIPTLAALAAVPWVGPASLERLRNFARANAALLASLEGASGSIGCTSSEACPGDEVCAIFPRYYDGEGQNTCRHPDTLPLFGADCAFADPLCGEDTICVGLSLGMPWGGQCSPAWMSTTELLGPFTVPAGGSATIAFHIAEQASVPMDVVFDFDVNATSPDATVTLENPYETVVPVWPHRFFPGATLQGRHAVFTPGDEAINGRWRLRVDNAGATPLSFGPTTVFMTSRWD